MHECAVTSRKRVHETMPAKCRWLINIPAIIERLSQMDIPVIDRMIFERVFEVRRRRAIDLMKRFGGGFECGNAGFLDRLKVIDQLRKLAAGDELERELQRKEHLGKRIDEASRYRSAAGVRIPISPQAMDRSFPVLPDGVCLSGGKLVAEYTTAEQLLQRLFEVAQAAANNFDAFREAVEASVPANPAAENPPTA